jgi:hypothetical protein
MVDSDSPTISPPSGKKRILNHLPEGAQHFWSSQAQQLAGNFLKSKSEKLSDRVISDQLNNTLLFQKAINLSYHTCMALSAAFFFSRPFLLINLDELAMSAQSLRSHASPIQPPNQNILLSTSKAVWNWSTSSGCSHEIEQDRSVV